MPEPKGWIPVTVTILDTRTGERRDYETSEPPVAWEDDGTWNDFMWSEGNYGCDCNRALFFGRAADEPDRDTECGEGRYRVRIVDQRNGAVLYDELTDAPGVTSPQGGSHAPE